MTTPGQYVSRVDVEPTASVKMAVKYIFDLGGSIFEEPTTHFCTLGTSPDWAKEKEVRGVIGQHVFYY